MLEHVCQGPLVSSAARQRERLVGERSAAREVGIPAQLLRLEREQARAAGRVRRIVQLERTLRRVNALLVDLAKPGAPGLTSLVRQGGFRCEVPVRQSKGDAGRLQQSLAMRWIAGLELGFAKPN